MELSDLRKGNAILSKISQHKNAMKALENTLKFSADDTKMAKIVLPGTEDGITKTACIKTDYLISALIKFKDQLPEEIKRAQKELDEL